MIAHGLPIYVALEPVDMRYPPRGWEGRVASGPPLGSGAIGGQVGYGSGRGLANALNRRPPIQQIQPSAEQKATDMARGSYDAPGQAQGGTTPGIAGVPRSIVREAVAMGDAAAELGPAILDMSGLPDPDLALPEPTFEAATERGLGTLRLDLAPRAREHIFILRQAGIDARIAYGARSNATQKQLYANRKPGFRVAPPGSSAHNFGAAYDIAIFDQGSYIEHGSDWRYQLSGRVGRDLLHLEWGGDWTTDPDFPHFQLPSWRQAPNLQLYTGP